MDNGIPPMVVCAPQESTFSQGLWFKDDPLKASLPILMLQMSLIISVSRALHYGLRHLGQPLFVSQMVTGIILGPSGLGKTKLFSEYFFPDNSRVTLNLVILIGLAFFFFMIAVKTDLNMLRKPGKKAMVIVIFGTVTPVALTTGTRYLLEHFTPHQFHETEIIKQISLMWCVSSYTNLSCLLLELNLLNSKLGRLAMKATVIGDTSYVLLRSIAPPIVTLIRDHTIVSSLGSIGSFIGLIMFIVFIARPITLKLIRQTPDGMPLNQPQFLAILMLSLACAFLSQVIGHPANVGIVMFGLTLPSGPPLGSTMTEKLEGLIMNLYMPLFFASCGLRMDVAAITNVRRWGYVQLFIVISVAGKFAGAVAPFLYWRVPWKDAVSIGLMMNVKSIYEIDALNSWRDKQIIDELALAVVFITVVAWMAIAAPLLKALYKPSEKFVAHKKRTIQFAKQNAELKILACIHNQENVSPAISILEASHPTKETPISIHILHLIQLVGRADAVLIPFDDDNNNNNNVSEYIINAFRRQFNQQRQEGGVSVQLFISISPYATMHQDICTLALEKKVSMVIVPFHKQFTIDGTMESVNLAYQTMNTNVLNYTPCSVAILIDHRRPKGTYKHVLPNQRKHNIALYFLGGADDREALALVTRMAGNPIVGLTVVRFRPPEEWRYHDEEEKLDDYILNEFMFNYQTAKDRVVYREEEVRDGEEMVSIIRAMSSEFSLLVVGRREGMESRLTSAMFTWSECPELGIIGDMLASTEFGTGAAATLVVQQQKRVLQLSEANGKGSRERFVSMDGDVEEGLAHSEK